jgi:hypothetical protein
MGKPSVKALRKRLSGRVADDSGVIRPTGAITRRPLGVNVKAAFLGL